MCDGDTDLENTSYCPTVLNNPINPAVPTLLPVCESGKTHPAPRLENTPNRELDLIYFVLTNCAYRWLCYSLLLSQARLTNPSVDRFQYVFPVRNTAENDPRCVLMGSKLAGLLTAKC